MSLVAGGKLGPYEIAAKLGEGGMGEVWRATDTRLRREVAIKVLPAAFVADPERLARFEREAQALAQLQHPNIASIYGLEESADARGLVMELVEGPTLAERLERGALPIDEALPIARQIAEALEAAHEKGIVHRDLKPQNVKVTAGGTVKVLDFGLAKALEPPGLSSAPDAMRSPTLMNSPTLTAAGTQLGVILGTAAYMSPEQARGGAVDKRADIWAFGVVLYEMLAGGTLFAGPTVTDTLAGVLRNEIDWSALPAELPAAVRRLLRRCLERDPKRRLHDVADARIVLDEVLSGRVDEAPATVVAPPARRSPAARALPWLLGLAAGAALVAVADRTVLAPPPAEPPRLVSLTYTGKDTAPVASPDGKTVAFVSSRDGRARVWLKQLATGEEVALTEGPYDAFPRFSPDGSSLLFVRGATAPYDLYRVATVGGRPRRITGGLASNADWSPDGRSIALTRASRPSGNPDSLASISVEGEGEREIARFDDLTVIDIRWSPDGSAIGALSILPTNFAAQQRVVEFDVASGERRTIYDPGPSRLFSGFAWSGPQAVLVVEAESQAGRGGTLLRRIDRHSGESSTLLSLRQPATGIDVAGPGRVVVGENTPIQNLGEWPLGTGEAPAAPARWWTRGASVDRQPVFSPDGARIAFNSDRGGNLDIWELELATGSVRRLTVAAGDDWDPGFTRDGRHLLWSSNRSGNYEIWIAAADGSGPRKLTSDGVDAENPTATPDGEWIVYASANTAHSGVWKIRPDGSDAQRVAAGVLSIPEVSPDGRWFSALDTANSQVRVFDLADGAEVAALELPALPFGVAQVGRSRWLPGSSSLVWVDYDLELGAIRLVAQEIARGRDTRAGRRTLLTGSADLVPESFAISPDGERLIVSVGQGRADLLMIEGLAGVGR